MLQKLTMDKKVLVTTAFAGVTNENTKSVTIGFKMIPKWSLFKHKKPCKISNILQGFLIIFVIEN